MDKRIIKALWVVVGAVLVVQTTGCGTLMYPERRGQKGGHVDAGIAVLDGIGLFFFLIPGIVAYAVDFSNGTIYLPPTTRSSLDLKDLRQVKFDHTRTTVAELEKIILVQTGCAVRFDQANMVITRLESSSDMRSKFASVLPEMKDKRLSMAH